MGATQKPFAALHRDLAWFFSCPEIRILHVATGGEELPIVLQQVALAEGHPRNRSPFFLLEDAHTRVDDGWAMRAERMRAIHASRREAMAREGHKVPILAPLEKGDVTLAAFAAQIRQCLDAYAAVDSLEGLVLVLAPTRLEDGKTFVESIRRLATADGFVDVRFIVVELGETTRAPFAREFAETFLGARCFIDREARHREMSARLDAAAVASAGASPEVLAGGAGPRGVPAPLRYGKPDRDAPLPPEVVAALGEHLGPAAALLGTPGMLLRQRVLGAASAIQKGKFAEAIRLQSEARDQCYSAGLEQLGLVLEITRASYAVFASHRKAARAAYDAAAQRATASGHFDLAAQALLGAAHLAALDKDWPDAARLANRAGQAGERGAQATLAIEGYRCAGQFGLRAGSEKVAIDRWTRALEIAKAAPPEAASRSSGPIVARALAKVLRGHGSAESAASLLREAEEMERGVGQAPKKKRKKGKRARTLAPGGTEIMTSPARGKGPTDSEIAEHVRPRRKSVTPTGTEVLAEPLAAGDDDVRR